MKKIFLATALCALAMPCANAWYRTVTTGATTKSAQHNRSPQGSADPAARTLLQQGRRSDQPRQPIAVPMHRMPRSAQRRTSAVRTRPQRSPFNCITRLLCCRPITSFFNDSDDEA